MQFFDLLKKLLPALAALVALYLISSSPLARNPSRASAAVADQGCPSDDSGLNLPVGFCATVFADSIGHARHMVVAPNGVVYVNTWSGEYYDNETPHAGGFLVALQDRTGPARPTLSSASARPRRGAAMAAPASGCTKAGSTRRSTTASCATRCPPARSYRGRPRDRRLRLAARRRPPMHPFMIDAKGTMSSTWPGDQLLPGRRIAPGIAGHRSLHRTRDARRHLALRRQQDASNVLAGGALRHRNS